jgi:hypothetical protein
MAGTPAIVFIHLGPDVPAWLPDALTQARAFNRGRIVVAAQTAALAQLAAPASLTIERVAVEDLSVSDKHRAFRALAPFDHDFRGGFWTHTTERFFVLEALMAHLALPSAVHVENDVMLYCDLEALAPTLAALYAGLAVTFDNDQRCVPGFIYVPQIAAITALNDFIVEMLQKLRATYTPEQLHGLNDMMILGHFRTRGFALIDHLPIVPPDYPGELRSPAGHMASDRSCYSRHFAELRTVFDAAALGQFLGGIDVRNAPTSTQGFVNESCVFDPRKVNVRMATDDVGRRVPVIETPAGVWPVANLHIHSKNLRPFLSV